MILFVIITFILLYIIGQVVEHIFKMQMDNIVKSIVDGFCITLALFQLIAYPIQIREGSFYFLVGIIIFGVVFTICLFTVIYKQKGDLFSIKKVKRQYLGIKILFLLLIVIQLVGSSWFYHEDDDDAYYVALSTSMIETGVVTSDMQYVTTGVESNIGDIRPNISTWEAFIAVCAFLFKIHPAILAHTVMPFLLILIAYMTIYCVAEKLFCKEKECEKKSLYFCVFFCILNIFAGYAVYSTGCFLLLRIWQGKAVLVNIIFPALLVNCLSIMNGSHGKRYFIWNSILLIAGVCTTVIGVYLLPIYYLIVGIPYLIITDWKISRKLLFRAVASLLPIVVYGVAALLTIVTNNAEYLNAAPPSWMVLFKRNMLQGYNWVLFLISLFYIIFYGKRIPKIFLIGSTLGLFLSFLNPLFCKIVAQKITGVDVYWRLYWIVPLYYAISYAVVELLLLVKRKYLRCIELVLMIFIIGKSGYFIYQDPYFYEHKNLYKLPNEVINIVDTILDDSIENPCVLLPENLGAKVRQYSANIKLVVSRYSYQKNNKIEGMNETVGDFYQYLYNKQEYNIEYLTERLLTLKVDYLVCKNGNGNLESERIHLKDIVDGYQIYYIER